MYSLPWEMLTFSLFVNCLLNNFFMIMSKRKKYFNVLSTKIINMNQLIILSFLNKEIFLTKVIK